MARKNKGNENINTLLGSGADPKMSTIRGNIGSEQSVSGKTIDVTRGSANGMTATGKGGKESSPMTSDNRNTTGFGSNVSAEPRSEFNSIDNAGGGSSEAKRKPGFSKGKTIKGTSG